MSRTSCGRSYTGQLSLVLALLAIRDLLETYGKVGAVAARPPSSPYLVASTVSSGGWVVGLSAGASTVGGIWLMTESGGAGWRAGGDGGDGGVGASYRDKLGAGV